LTANIQDLHLLHSKITGAQLLRFIRPDDAFLKTLILSHVHGFSNSELFTLLSSVARTLTTLRITYCTIPRDNEEEEFALDAVMPQLSAIETVSTAGDCISVLAIARKAESLEPDSMSRATSRPYFPSIGISAAPTLDCECLPSAVNTTGWKTISIARCEGVAKAEMSVKQDAREIAASRGISLFLDG
jgi:hypothetical protein